MTQSRLVNVIFLCFVNSIFIIAGTVLNSLVILCLWKSSLLQKKLCYFLILILSCCDLTVVIVNHPSIIYLAVAWVKKDHHRSLEGEKIFSAINNALLGFSSSTLLIMNIERYLATIHPIFHRGFVTKKRVVAGLGILVALTLVLAAFEASLPRTVFSVATMFVVAIYIGSIFFMNYKMFKIAMGVRRNGTNKQSSVNFKCASTCLWAASCFFACSVPYLFFYCFMLSSTFREEVLTSFHLWASTAVTLDSTFNCLLFFWRNKVLRIEGEKILRRCLSGTSRVNVI